MRATRIRIVLPILLTAVCFGCTSAGEVQPIVIDLSKKVTPTPSAAVAPAPAPLPRDATAPPRKEPVAPAAVTSIAVPPAPPPATGTAADRIARAFEDAYNRHDAESLAALFATDALIYEPPDRLRDSGADQIRQTFARRFAAAPGTSLRVSERWTQGNFVVERRIESAGDAEVASVVISEILNGRIVRVWILH